MNKILLILSMAFLIAMASSAGATILGFSDITLKTGTSGNLNSGKYWIVTWTDDGSKYEFLNAVLPPSEFQSETGSATKQSFTIQASGTKNRCELDIVQLPGREDISTGKVVYYDVPPWYCPSGSDVINGDSALQSWIDQNCWNGYVCQNGWVNDRIWCIRKDQKLGTVGETRNLAYRFDTTFTVKAGDKAAQTAVVSNSATGSGKSTNVGSDVSIEWVGSLSSGETCPATINQLAAHSNNFAGSWRLIDNNNYAVYETFVKNDMDDLLLQIASGQKSTSQAESEINTKAYTAVTQKTYSKSVTVLDESVSSGKIKFDLANQIIFPQFRMLIDADYLELVILTGKPQIVSAAISKFSEGGEGDLKVIAKNIGQGPGNFELRVTGCSSEFSSSTAYYPSLAAGEQKEYHFPMSCSSDKKVAEFSGSCVVEMKTKAVVGQQQLTDTKNIGMTCTSITQCTPNYARCDEVKNAIVKCKSDGTDEVVDQQCTSEESCVLVQSVPTCKAKEAVSEQPQVTTPVGTDWFLITVIIAVVAIIGIAILRIYLKYR